MNKVYLILGGNLGNRLQNIKLALKYIEEKISKPVLCSSVYETEPWGMSNQPAFYNQVVLIQTPLDSVTVLQRILAIEQQMGRVRQVRYGSRIIDIDILLFNQEIRNSAEITLPHPRMQERLFVLKPLAEIAPDLMHPVLHKTVRELLEACTDNLKVHRLDAEALKAAVTDTHKL